MIRSRGSKGQAAKAELDAWLRELPSEQGALVRALRALVRRIAPSCEESLVWRALAYHRPEIGGRVKGAVCMIEAKDGRVLVSFIHGARLADPFRLLEGTAKSKRFVPVASESDVARPGLAELIREAAAIEW